MAVEADEVWEESRRLVPTPTLERRSGGIDQGQARDGMPTADGKEEETSSASRAAGGRSILVPYLELGNY